MGKIKEGGELSRVNVIIPVGQSISIPYLIRKLKPVLKGTVGPSLDHVDDPYHHVNLLKSARFNLSLFFFSSLFRQALPNPPLFESNPSKHVLNSIPRGVLRGLILQSYLAFFHVSFSA